MIDIIHKTLKKASRWAPCLVAVLLWQTAHGQIAISVSGNWSTVLDVASVTEAGNDFHSSYLSASNAVMIDVFKTAGSNAPFNWRVDVRKSDVDWGSNLQLFVRRTGDGFAPLGNSAINGGTSFQLLTNNNQLFFSGRRQRYDIPIQFQLTGVSVLLPAKTHVTTVIYTVTEL